MKRYIYIIAIALATSLSAAAQKTIEILHTNDTHSCIMPLNPNLADTLVAGRGGFIRRMEMIRQERKANPDVARLRLGRLLARLALLHSVQG